MRHRGLSPESYMLNGGCSVGQPLCVKTGVETENLEDKMRIISGMTQPGDDIVMTKWVGLEGTVRIANQKKEELFTRFPSFMVEEAIGFEKFLSVLPEEEACAENNLPMCERATAMMELSEGGVYGGLWELAQHAGVGLEIFLKKIPIRQETVEICNFYDIDPYRLLSGGSLLVSAGNGNRIAQRLLEAGIPAAVIGRATAGNDRVVVSGSRRRFLEPFRREDEDGKLKHRTI